eukprot:3882689-Prymnesium_polylepis.1
MAMATSLAHQRFVQMELEQRRNEQQQLHDDAAAGVFEAPTSHADARRPPRASGTATRIRPEDSAIIDRLLDPINNNLAQFTAFINATRIGQRHTYPPAPTVMRVVRFVPHNP